MLPNERAAILKAIRKLRGHTEDYQYALRAHKRNDAKSFDWYVWNQCYEIRHNWPQLIPSGWNYKSNYILCEHHGPLPDEIEVMGDVMGLNVFKYQLPSNLRKVGFLVLNKYKHALPARLQIMGETHLSSDYKYQLPEGLLEMGEVTFCDYELPLPSTLRKIAWVRGMDTCKVKLPEGCKIDYLKT